MGSVYALLLGKTPVSHFFNCVFVLRVCCGFAACSQLLKPCLVRTENGVLLAFGASRKQGTTAAARSTLSPEAAALQRQQPLERDVGDLHHVAPIGGPVHLAAVGRADHDRGRVAVVEAALDRDYPGCCLRARNPAGSARTLEMSFLVRSPRLVRSLVLFRSICATAASTVKIMRHTAELVSTGCPPCR